MANRFRSTTQLGWYLEMIKALQKQQSGMMLVSILIITAVLVLIGFSLASLTVGQYSISNTKVFSANGLMVAEAGIEQSLLQLNSNDNFTGYPTEQEFFNNTTQGRGTYSVTVANTSDTNAKIITSTSKVYRYNKTTNPVSTKIVKVTVVGTSSEGYSVHTGPGGLLLGGSANITNSDVYVNGTISLSGAAKIGTSAFPLDVKVANQVCPTGNNPGATYPTVCTSGQPITTQHSTNIYGSVCATGQTSNNNGSNNPAGNILPGNGGAGLILGCVAPVVQPPSYDKAAQLAAVTTTAAGNSNTYTCQSWPFDRTWPSNLKLTGNVTVGGSCNVTIKGNTYITGDLDINGASKITVDSSAGTTRPVVIVDGKITIAGSAQMIANAQGTGIQFISFKSNAPCASNCTTITGTNLKNTQGLETVKVGGGVNLPGMIFQSYWGKITIAGSGSIGAAVGQTVDMSGAGTVVFGTSLSSGDRTWTITSYQEKFPN